MNVNVPELSYGHVTWVLKEKGQQMELHELESATARAGRLGAPASAQLGL